jgi:hypothetical protein
MPKRLHVDFAQSHSHAANAGVVTFRALEIQARPDMGTETKNPVGGITTEERRVLVRPAEPAELPRVFVAAAAVYPPGFLEAHALAPQLEAPWQAWADAGLRRGREIAVAEREGRLEAAAVLEYGEDGVHLFGLFDVVRIFPINRLTDETASALLEYAKAFFARLGKSTFLYASEPTASQAQWPIGAIDRALIHCTFMSTALLPEFADHVWELTIGGSE